LNAENQSVNDIQNSELSLLLYPTKNEYCSSGGKRSFEGRV